MSAAEASARRARATTRAAIESLAPCAECGEETSHDVQPPDEDGVMQLVCQACGTEMF